jgi:hypothetical protein
LKSSVELSPRPVRARAIAAAVVALIASGLAAGASGAPAPQPDRASAAALLEQFRRSIWAEPVYAEFDLRQMPRRGPERAYRGRFWGARNDQGPATRIELDIGHGGFTHRFLVQGGPFGAVWTSDGAGAGTLSEDAAATPLVPGVEMTPFDVLPMPFLYWLDYKPAGAERIRGRPANIYVFLPSADFTARNPGIRSVRAYLDAQYDALEQSEIIGSTGRVSKTLTLLELRKVGDRWIPKDLDVRNESTRDKTRLSLTAVAVGVQPNAGALDPSQLGLPLAPPPTSHVLRMTP